MRSLVSLAMLEDVFVAACRKLRGNWGAVICREREGQETCMLAGFIILVS